MTRYAIPAGAFFAGTAVILGAFGAHGLQKLDLDAKILHGFQTGVAYQMYHALGLIMAGLFSIKYPHSWLIWTMRCFIAGIICFSGSLYLITALFIQDSHWVKFVGPVTPVGGMFFIIGWMFLLAASLKGVRQKNG